MVAGPTTQPRGPAGPGPAGTRAGFGFGHPLVRLDLDDGARLLAALDLARSDVSAETPRTRADALMVLAESFLAEGARSRAGGTPTEVRLYVTEDEFESGGGFIENAGWVGVSAETSRRLACDAAVVEVVERATA